VVVVEQLVDLKEPGRVGSGQLYDPLANSSSDAGSCAMGLQCYFEHAVIGSAMVAPPRPRKAGARRLPPRRATGFCCIWSTGGMPKPCQPRVQIAKASSSNATATRRVTGSSTASS
jgi:hypothetical protein